jgi:uncharacterized protein YecT (DUF1311 family)
VLGKGQLPIDRYWRSCPDRARADNGDLEKLIGCSERAFKLADTELNRVYAAKIRSLPSARRKALRLSQRGWLKTRDKDAEDCASPWTPEGHEYPMQFAMCRASLTIERTDIVRRFR